MGTRRLTVVLLASLVLVAGLAPPSAAAPSDFDETFGDGGVATLPLDADATVDDVAATAEGGLVVVGTTGEVANPTFVMKLDVNGDLDSLFEDGGLSLYPHLDFRGVAIDSESRIVVFGRATPSGGQGRAIVLRLLADGSRDPSFDGDGQLFIGFLDGVQFGDVAVDRRDRVVVGFDESIRRFTEAGVPDTSFSGDGHAPAGVQNVGSVAVDQKGRIVVLHQGPQSRPPQVARLALTGALDAGFGTGGLTEFPDAIDCPAPWALAVQADSSVVVGVTSFCTFGSYDPFVVRWSARGRLDHRFDGDGMVELPLEPHGDVRALQVDTHGYLWAAALSRPTGAADSDLVVVRLRPTGRPDKAFGTRGVAIVRPAASDPSPAGLAIDGAGRVLVASNEAPPTVLRLVGVPPA